MEFDDGYFDTVISTECFEHDMYFDRSLRNIIRMLRPGGCFLFTCGTTGRPRHGTIDTGPKDSPFTVKMDNNWKYYYGNITEELVREIIDVDKCFVIYQFNIDLVFCYGDLRFVGIKR